MTHRSQRQAGGLGALPMKERSGREAQQGVDRLCSSGGQLSPAS